MKRIAMTLFSLAIFAMTTSADEEATDTAKFLVDLGKCNLVVEEVHKVASIKGARGKTIKASKKGAVLVELKIHGTGVIDGEFGLYPSMFSLTCEYRRVHRILPSLAIGIKPKLPSGEIQEYWLNDPEATMLIGCDKGESIDFYALFEVPAEVKEFNLQVPMGLQPISTDDL